MKNLNQINERNRPNKSQLVTDRLYNLQYSGDKTKVFGSK